MDLVIRAAFVPEGDSPPPELGSDFTPLKFRATLDTSTGAITGDEAGASVHGDVRAEWHPDADQGSGDGEASAVPDGDTNAENVAGSGNSG